MDTFCDHNTYVHESYSENLIISIFIYFFKLFCFFSDFFTHNTAHLKNARIETSFILGVGLMLSFLLMFRLEHPSLQSYDEAWYGSISRSLLELKNLFSLEFNTQRFADHSPLGFLFQAMSMKIFGPDAFGVRFVRVVFGLLALYVVYLLAPTLADKTTGVIAVSILMPSLWFLFRARSGNLDVPIKFWEVFTLYSLVNHGERALLVLASIGLAGVFLTKTVVGIGRILVVVWTMSTT